jgi:eukaryotic-like serine/threonine-protein kinase
MAVEVFGGRYEPTHELTRAGPVVVHATRDRWLGRSVALAVHDPKSAAADDAAALTSRAHFHALARMLMRVAHPNVADAYDAGRHEGVYFVAFERPPSDLASELARTPWDEQDVVRVAAELTIALDVVHREGGCLDSLHPGHVGLSADGRVRLAPWPLAPPPGGWGGERAWLAPERVAGGPSSVRADVWSAGAVVLSAMIGAGPGRLDHDAITEVSGRIMQTWDPVLVAATARSMSGEPSDRYASAGEMAAALDSAAAAGLVAVDAHGGVDRAAPRIRTRPLRVLAPRGGSGWRAAAAAVAAVCIPVVALQLRSAAPSVAGCRAAEHALCPGRTDAAPGPSLPAVAPVAPAPEVQAAAAGVAVSLPAPRPTVVPVPRALPAPAPAVQSAPAHAVRSANHGRGSHPTRLRHGAARNR